jgi:predicted phage tail protein
LTWLDNSDNETGFVIERATDGVNFSVLTTVAANTMNYVDAAVSGGITYDYRVAAVNVSVNSTYSNTASVTIPVPPPPAAPSDLQAVFEDGPQIDLAWADNSDNETGFVIERGTDGVNFSALATVGADTINYLDTAVLAGVTYHYRVAAVNNDGTSAFSNIASATVPADATAPAAPMNLSATNITQTALTLNWQDMSANEDGFTIQRSTNIGFTRNVVTINVGPNMTSYADSGLKRNTTYYYRIVAFNITGVSPWSLTLTVTTPK